MTLNPIIEAARNPVEAFALLGFLGLLCTSVVLSVIYPLRVVPALWADWTHRERDREWRDGPHGIGHIPPVSWILMAASVPFSVCVFGFVMSALAWVLL